VRELLPVAHPFFVDLTFERNDTGRQDRGVHGDAVERRARRVEMRGCRIAFEERAVTREDVRRAERSQRRDVVRARERGKRLRKRFSAEVRADFEFATDDFQRRSP
jgi:hypothetical protein